MVFLCKLPLSLVPAVFFNGQLLKRAQGVQIGLRLVRRLHKNNAISSLNPKVVVFR